LAGGVVVVELSFAGGVVVVEFSLAGGAGVAGVSVAAFSESALFAAGCSVVVLSAAVSAFF
jgi:hypothetical protein